MGSRYFSSCAPDDRFYASKRIPLWAGGHEWMVRDWDQRRTITVIISKDVDEEFISERVAALIDDLPPGTVQIKMSDDGGLVSSSEEDHDDRSMVPFYPQRTEFPRRTPTVQRQDLIETDRLGVQVDLVTYRPRSSEKPGEMRTAVFKYYVTENNVALLWHELNCVMRMPRHPNIVPFDALVVDKIDSVDRVVGFTTVFIPGGTLHENQNRLFKLKYLEQLISAVDHLNLRLGIVHGDICPWNLLIDHDTDTLQLFDFNTAAKMGWEGDASNHSEFAYEAVRNDVKFVVLTLYEIITREFCFRLEFYPEELDASEFMEKPEWEKHNDVQLDSPVEKYRRVLADWVEKRAEVDKKVDHFSKAAEPLNWPPLDLPPEMAQDESPFRRRGWYRSALLHEGRSFLQWARPPTAALPLPQGKHLLATGEIACEE